MNFSRMQSKLVKLRKPFLILNCFQAFFLGLSTLPKFFWGTLVVKVTQMNLLIIIHQALIIVVHCSCTSCYCKFVHVCMLYTMWVEHINMYSPTQKFCNHRQTPDMVNTSRRYQCHLVFTIGGTKPLGGLNHQWLAAKPLELSVAGHQTLNVLKIECDHTMHEYFEDSGTSIIPLLTVCINKVLN